MDPGTKGLMAFRKFCVLWNLTHNEDYWIYRAWYSFTVLGLKFVEKKGTEQNRESTHKRRIIPYLEE